MKIRENISDHTAAAIRKVRRLFFPAWYLPNGTINATEDELEGASESCERWAIWCGALVIVSVIAELVIALVHPSYGLFLELSAITDVGVGLGIIGEVMLGMRNNKLQTELRRRSNEQVASAIDRASKAELEIAKLKAPRQLTGEEIDRIGAVLKPLGAFPYDLSVPTLLEPGSTLINCLVLALNKAGWTLRSMQGNVEMIPPDNPSSQTVAAFAVLPPPGPPGSSQTLHVPPIVLGRNSDVMGVLILSDPFGSKERAQLFPPAMALKNALTEVGVVAQCFAAHTKNNMAADVIHISVGAKP
jgi:hypothetical protein